MLTVEREKGWNIYILITHTRTYKYERERARTHTAYSLDQMSVFLGSNHALAYPLPTFLDHALRTRHDVRRGPIVVLQKDLTSTGEILFESKCTIGCVTDSMQHTTRRTLGARVTSFEEELWSHFRKP